MHVYTINPVTRSTDGSEWTHSASYELHSDTGHSYVVYCTRYFNRLERKAHYETEIYVSGRRVPETQLTNFRKFAVRIFKQDVREFAENL